MSVNHPIPRQDRRHVGRSVVRSHNSEASVGVSKSPRDQVKAPNDPLNGQLGPGEGSAPGSNGVPTTGPTGGSEW